jgi:HSP20 family molecular chaperone IbpA
MCGADKADCAIITIGCIAMILCMMGIGSTLTVSYICPHTFRFPPIDVYEHATDDGLKEIYVDAHLPGLPTTALVDIYMKNTHTLVIETHEHTRQRLTPLHMRPYVSHEGFDYYKDTFYRQIRFDRSPVVPSSPLQATYKHGVLRIVLKKDNVPIVIDDEQ